jgi:signal peptidase I
MTTTSASSKPNAPEETNIVETVQSLIVAFSLAMGVRSFVTEGFVIPTGSMAPTLMGQHLRPTSPATGYSYPIDAGPAFEVMRMLGQNYRDAQRPIIDPMLSQVAPIEQVSNTESAQQSRMGDRVLVLKFLYPFREPERWDVVVFKNPTDPTGDAANFIKRLVGLPNEQLLFLDGDVFTAPLGAGREKFAIQRKPEHVQRAVWQPVHDSDFVPGDLQALARAWNRSWPGPPWESKGFDMGKDMAARVWTHGDSSRATLDWRWDIMPVTDFTPYNLWRDIPASQRYGMSDIRVSAAIVADDPAKLATEYTLEARKKSMRFSIRDGKASIRIETAKEGPQDAVTVLGEKSVPFAAPAAGAPFEVEFWHVDQRLSLFVNGDEVVSLDDSFESLEDRLLASFNGRTVADYTERATFQQPTPPKFGLAFEGSPLSLERVRVDRDLYYRPAILREDPFNQPPQNGAPISGAAFATDFTAPAQLEADEFVMCGDNSAASRDSRLWGRPSPLVTSIFGEDKPFVVPRPLLLGKAWCVYFPAPVSPLPGGKSYKMLPDFGQLRFIR